MLRLSMACCRRGLLSDIRRTPARQKSHVAPAGVTTWQPERRGWPEVVLYASALSPLRLPQRAWAWQLEHHALPDHTDSGRPEAQHLPPSTAYPWQQTVRHRPTHT